MNTALRVLLTLLLVFVVAWVLIFGTSGALLARHRGTSGVTGFLWGMLLGPLGWLAIFLTTRNTVRTSGFNGSPARPVTPNRRNAGTARPGQGVGAEPPPGDDI